MCTARRLAAIAAPSLTPGGKLKTGAIMIAPSQAPFRQSLARPRVPSSASSLKSLRAPDANGHYETVPAGSAACLSSASPASMARTIYGDNERFQKTYGPTFRLLLHRRRRASGRRRLLLADGRVDTSSTYRAIASAPWKSSPRSSHIPKSPNRRRRRPDISKVSHCRLRHPRVRQRALRRLKDELRKWVTKEIGALARPDDIRFTEALPKTRSGKIMRRLLRDLAHPRRNQGDVTSSKTSPSSPSCAKRKRASAANVSSGA